MLPNLGLRKRVLLTKSDGRPASKGGRPNESIVSLMDGNVERKVPGAGYWVPLGELRRTLFARMQNELGSLC